jgi:periplasmic divalent cation tolerance protein
MNQADAVVVVTTTSGREEASRLARMLVESRLAACVQVVSGVESYYWWNGAVTHEPECLLFCKTLRTSYPACEHFLKEHHSYEVPEIIALPVTAGLRAYLDWMSENVSEREAS